ncbi:DUF4126 family protein [Sphingomicrobium clamense]|uniref:DUF4126 family protein n=1 Tax=Sphingomicrobium clamense TaxID=2851013 RepID=A0ABS6V4S5_9SPHN|nr:DUF4126 family protein [Sphingomicrobium sp. B8]MBW0144202.1 DUF4126 family protein [Sphingomicrobium sp. B8]
MLLASALIGFASGSRTFLAIALTAWAVSFGWVDTGVTFFDWLGAPALAAVLTLLAFGELYGDKQPQMGARTRFPALLARLLAGGIAGGALAAGADMAWLGVGMGAGAALIGTFATYRMRKWLAGRLGRDLPAALFEDALTLLLAVAALALIAS